MIFTLLLVYNHDRVSPIRVLHTTTWDYFTLRLPDRFSHSPKVVKEAIMTDVNDLVQEFWRTSSDGVVGGSFFAMRRLRKILQECFDFFDVCFDIVSIFATAVDLADKNLQVSANPNSWQWYYSAQWDVDDPIRAKFKILFDGYRKMFDQSLSKSKDLADMLRFLPGVVVQKYMSLRGMADLYRIEPALLERFIKFTFEPPIPFHAPYHRYTLDDAVSGFLEDRNRSQLYYCDPMLQHFTFEPPIMPFRAPYLRYILDDSVSSFLEDRDRSQLYYCDPMLQHISICRHFLSILDGSNAVDLQS